MELEGKRVALGVTDGIAAYKMAELTRRLIRESASVRVARADLAARARADTAFRSTQCRVGMTANASAYRLL